MTTEGKIEFSIGDISFVGEGDQEWVAEQLDKILEKAPHLTKIVPKKKGEFKNKGIYRGGRGKSSVILATASFIS
jgi:hypothetical protein